MPNQALHREGVLDALRDIRAEAHRLEEGPGYPMVSVRGLAKKLGHEALLPDILEACIDGGFQHCLDHTVPLSARYQADITVPQPLEYPSQAVCCWGADQLRSRLDCVDYKVYANPARF